MTTRKRIQAAEIIAKINNRSAPVYQNVEFVGILDFTTVGDDAAAGEPERFIGAPLSFVNCVFKAPLIACRVSDELTIQSKFARPVTFAECKFESSLDFRHAQFVDVLNLRDTLLSGEANFQGAMFSEEIIAGNTQFLAGANWRSAQFLGEVDFQNAVFSQDVNFAGAEFLQETNWQSVQFLGRASFDRVQFTSADFAFAWFAGPANFDGSVFLGYVWFTEAHFLQEASFGSVRFEQRADFGSVSFVAPPAFAAPKFEGGVNFAGAICQDLPFDPTA